MVVSLLDFLRTERLGEIELGMSLETVEQLFGEPFVRDGTVQVKLWVNGDSLSCIDLWWSNSPLELDCPLKDGENPNRFSINMVLDWSGISPHSPFETPRELLHPLGIKKIQNAIVVSQRHESFALKSGVLVEVRSKSYTHFYCHIGDRNDTARVWNMEAYLETM